MLGMQEMETTQCGMCGRTISIPQGATAGSLMCPSCGAPVALSAAPMAATAAASDVAAEPTAAEPTAAEPTAAEPTVAEAVVPPVVAAPVPAFDSPLTQPVVQQASDTQPVPPAAPLPDPTTQPVEGALAQPVAQAYALDAQPPVPQLPTTATPGAIAEGQATPLLPMTAPPAASPANAAPQMTATAPYPPAGYPAAGYAAMPPTAPAPKRSRGPLVAIILTAVAVILLACIAAGVVFAMRVQRGISQAQHLLATQTATQQATATPQPLAGFATYSDAAGGYTIAYPQTWSKKSTSGDFGLTIFSGAGQSAGSVFEVETVKSNSTDTSALLDGYVSGLGNTGTVSNVAGPTSVTVGGVTWSEKSADLVTKDSSIAFHTVVLATNHNGTVYLIADLAPQAEFTTLDTQDFTPMLNSFAFTN